MESFPEMTNKVTTLVRATGIEDPGRMSGAGTERPDPEVPERARRRTFTAKYKLEILAAGALAALAAPRGRRRRDARDERIAALQAEKQRLEQELAKARFVVDVQAKLHALLETLSENADTEPRSTS